MDMIFETLGTWILAILNMLDRVAFDFDFGLGTVSVSYLSLCIGFFALSMIISVFWKGAQG